MLVVITTVSSLVHLYSWGYMSDDGSKPRFFSYLSLFTFAMLMLVTSDNFIQLFFGWEGVGLASYLLIGYYFKKPSANAAAIKAFVTNRVGDVGLALGVMAIFFVFGSVNFDVVFEALHHQPDRIVSFLGMDINAIELIAFIYAALDTVVALLAGTGTRECCQSSQGHQGPRPGQRNTTQPGHAFTHIMTRVAARYRGQLLAVFR